MKHARIEEGTVREVIDFDPAGKFHHSLIWAACPDDTEQGDLYDGATFSKPPPPPVPPPPILTCTPWQIRKALTATGLRASVETAIALADQTTQDGWEYATEFRRDDPLVVGMGAALNKTEAELDALFALARSL